MFKAKTTDGDLIFGITKENVERLMKGQPIAFNLNKMGLEDRKVMIMYGENEDKIYEQLVDHMSLNTKINDEQKPYRMIEGTYIEEEWMQFPDFPEPPDEKEVPTDESQNQWDAYRAALEKFSAKYRLG